MNKNINLNQCELGETLVWWQEALGLQAWDVTIKLGTASELEDAEGTCEWTLTRRSATIQLLDPRYRERSDKTYDMEYVLVHELLHIVFACWDDWTRDEKRPLHPVLDATCIEQPIDSLAKLFVVLRRNQRQAKFLWEHEF